METERIKSELISTARLRLQHYGLLVEMAEEQQSILIQGRHSELAENIAGFDSLLLELSKLSKREELLVCDLADSRSEASDISSTLCNISEEMLKHTERLRELSRSNMQLLNNAMEFIDFSIGIICGAVGPGQSGRAGSPSILLDLKV
ncbi:MAG: flagellar export chaperone FlgN [Armatimonadota bacterium]